MSLRHLTFPKPSTPQEFEAFCLALYQQVWLDPNAQLNGSPGQIQNGVDIFGRDARVGESCGVQCKVRSSRLTLAEVEAEIEKAENFEPKLQNFVVATTANRDAALQTELRLLSERRRAAGLFPVFVAGWNDLTALLDEHPRVATRFFPLLGGLEKHVDIAAGSCSSSVSERVFSQRLSYALQLINDRKTYDPISVSRVAEKLNAERISDVAKYFDGREEPSIRFMRDFATKFGVNADWLIHGEDDAFYCKDPIAFTPLDAIPFFEQNEYEEIFFIRSNSEYGECAIVTRLDTYRYVTINGVWHVSSHVGATGRSQLEDLCQLFVHMMRKRMSFRGFALDDETFYKLKEGQIYPGSVLDGSNRSSDWCVSLLDIEHCRPGAPHYGKWHGHSFLEAQSILRQCLAPETKKLIQSVF